MKVLNFPSAYKSGETPYQIFKDRMVAISSIATGIKNMIANKYINNQMTMIADNILNKVDESKSTELIGLITGKPPEVIYPDDLENTVGAFIDKFAMGPMAQKETMMGGLAPPAPGIAPTGVPTGTPSPSPSPETMIGKPDINQLFSAISDMPSGQVNWANLFKTMSKDKPYFMGTTGPESLVAEQMMGQAKDPKDKLETDVNLAKLVQETFYPEKEPPSEWEKKFDALMQTDPTTDEVKKFVGAYITPYKPTEFDKKIDIIRQLDPSPDELKKLLGIYIPPDKQSDFEKKWDILMARDHTITEENKLLGTYIAPKTPSPTDIKTTTAEANFAEKQFEEVRTNDDYNKAFAKVRQVDKKVIVPTKIEIFKGNYDQALADVQILIGPEGNILDQKSKSGYSYEMLYAQAYKDLEQAINEYRIATGQSLDNPFVTPGEYNKSDIKPKEGLINLKPGTWGQQKSVFKSELGYKDGDIEVINGKTYKYNKAEDKWEELIPEKTKEKTKEKTNGGKQWSDLNSL